jgi:KDO2-lipid IV(A) lauroyltransferase
MHLMQWALLTIFAPHFRRMYYLLFAFFYLVSLLPFRVLYAISDVMAYVLYGVVRYRRQVVMENIRGSFPELPEAEVQRIGRRFYRNFTDNWFETIKLITLPASEIRRRASGNFELLGQLYAQDRPVCGISGHLFNWEIMSLAFCLKQPFEMITVYMPVSNAAMDRMFRYIRGRFGATLMAATTLHREIIPWRRKKYLIGLVSDQSPGDPANAYWLQFMNRPTAFVTGPERNTQVFGQVPFFVTVSRPKRGYYHFQLELLTDDAALMREKGAITRLAAAKTEANIRNAPDLYLWSHRRWKHTWQAAYAPLWIDRHYPVPEKNNGQD